MGYSIRYQADGGQLRHKHRKWGKVFISGLAASCGVILWYQLYNAGIISMVEELARAIGGGAPLKEAIEAFCLELLENA